MTAIARVPAGSTWAGSHDYTALGVAQPETVDELAELIRSGDPVRALGSRHSFTDLADTAGTLVSLERMPAHPVIDEARQTVTVSGHVRYGDLASHLQDHGWALHNMASLPHISVAGAIATGTHGSGDALGTLAAAVAALEFVDGSGRVILLNRGDADFAGSVVALGALGIVTRVTLEIQPTFLVRQDVFTDVPWDAALDNFDAATGAAYSVSLFTKWAGPTLGLGWLKSRELNAPEFVGGRRLSADRHVIEAMPAENCTAQSGVPGPWNDRLSHFRMGFTPSAGDELQSEYLLPRDRALEAIGLVRAMAEDIAPALLVSEIRTMAADDLWLSGAFGTPAVGLHFTWHKNPAVVAGLVRAIEERLLPLGARPHWGKVFAAESAELRELYPHFADFRALARKHDPAGIFRNSFLSRTLEL